MVSATSKNHKNRQNQSNECSIFGNIFPQTRPCLRIINHNQKIIFFPVLGNDIFCICKKIKLGVHKKEKKLWQFLTK